ncbi:hypothetical protein HELRODRAFT_163829 [Helobdella robusta]|uniref:Uncharacterized protein n=1 Tax=Helobdella robusta TaxID=6412 RepID=T1EUI6_HELRO|nr:hypothetical protein HELRODRAFT_163829 [Helobdella robusta]ESN96728.1 hypothetical protein HELRODRAFT_163829 [Helobdella robusta]
MTLRVFKPYPLPRTLDIPLRILNSNLNLLCSPAFGPPPRGPPIAVAQCSHMNTEYTGGEPSINGTGPDRRCRLHPAPRCPYTVTLFCMKINGLCNIILPDMLKCLYVDDFMIAYKNKNIENIENDVDNRLSSVPTLSSSSSSSSSLHSVREASKLEDDVSKPVEEYDQSPCHVKVFSNDVRASSGSFTSNFNSTTKSNQISTTKLINNSIQTHNCCNISNNYCIINIISIPPENNNFHEIQTRARSMLHLISHLQKQSRIANIHSTVSHIKGLLSRLMK